MRPFLGLGPLVGRGGGRDVGVRYANAGVLDEYERQKPIPERIGFSSG